MIQRIQVQLTYEDVEGLQGTFACGSLDKVLKDLPSLGLLLVLVLSHVSGAVWSRGVESAGEDTMKYLEK